MTARLLSPAAATLALHWMSLFLAEELLQCPMGCTCPSEREVLCRGASGEVPQLVEALVATRGGGVADLEALEAVDGDARELGNGSFRALSGLRRLMLDGNHIAHLDDDALGGATQLRELSLSGNLLERVPVDAFARAPALDRLFLSRNRLQLPKGAPLLHSSLRWLQMDACGFASLPDHVFQGTGNLRVLQLRDNALETLGRSLLTLQRLSVLALQGNRLVHQTFALPPSLQLLNVNDNDFSSVEKGMFDSAFNLEYLFLRNNFISNVHVRSFLPLKKLKFLDLGGNKLNNSLKSLSTDLSIGFSFMQQLSNLKIDGNEIETLNLEIFTKMKNLKEISLSRNKIKTITNLKVFDLESEYYEDDEDEAKPELEILTISENKISFLGSSLRPFMDSLRHLNLSSNKLSSFSSSRLTQESRSSLKLLDLSFNRINPSYGKALDLEYLPNLEHLSLRNNDIENMDENTFRRLKRLKYLDLSYNKFTTINSAIFRNQKELVELQLNFLNVEVGVESLPESLFASLSNLLTLSMEGNNIKYLPQSIFNSLTRVEILNLSNNNLDFFNLESLSACGNLKTINLKYNRLYYLSCTLKMTCTFTSVVDLNLEGNRFTHFERNLSTIFPSLESLDISNNRINHLELDVITSFQKLTTVRASFNPVPCDCDVQNAWKLYGGDQGSTRVEATCDGGRGGEGVTARPWATVAGLRCEGATETALLAGVVLLVALVAANVALGAVLVFGGKRENSKRGSADEGCWGRGGRDEESDDSDNMRNARVERWRGQALYYGTDSEDEEEDPARAGLAFEYDALRWAAARRANSRSTVNVSSAAY